MASHATSSYTGFICPAWKGLRRIGVEVSLSRPDMLIHERRAVVAQPIRKRLVVAIDCLGVERVSCLVGIYLGIHLLVVGGRAFDHSRHISWWVLLNDIP